MITTCTCQARIRILNCRGIDDEGDERMRGNAVLTLTCTLSVTLISPAVALEGVVDSQSDKNTAYIRASGVPGTFSVKNNLVVSK